MQYPTLTVFTPTYNRAHTLMRTYESLCRQTCKDFEWLIIDDGSTDNTEQHVFSWIAEYKIKIRYIKKSNGGLHTGYTTAIANIRTELNVCIDSDDFMPDDAVEKILTLWQTNNNNNIAGIIGLDFFIGSGPVGGYFSHEGNYHFFEQKYKLAHNGDTKIVCRTDLMRQFYPIPSFGEKNFNPVWYYIKVGENHKFMVVNHNFCFVDYQPDGMGAGIYRQYQNSPKSFAELRRVYMLSRHLPWYRKFIDAAHYVSSSIFSKDKNFIQKSPAPVLTIIAIPAGLIIHSLILYKLRK